MTIGQSIKIAINAAFVNTTFRGRDAITIRNTLNTKVHGSDNMLVIMPVPDVKVEKLDDTHDKITLIYDDVQIEGVITWIASKLMGNCFVFVKLE